MVFESLFKVQWIERKENAFFLGFFYSILGFVSALIIFPSSIGLMSMAFTSILLIPSLAMLLKMEENVQIREKKLSLRSLFRDHKDIFKVYIFMFLGIFIAYSIITLILSQPAIKVMFAAQLKAAGITGMATGGSLLTSIIMNNILVFVVAFILSLMYGAGAVLFLTWNASVWGVVFSYFIKKTAALSSSSPVQEFIGSIIPFLPHMVTEATAYISAAIVGGVISKAVLREKTFSKKFNHILTDALIFMLLGLALVIVAGIIEVKFFAGL